MILYFNKRVPRPCIIAAVAFTVMIPFSAWGDYLLLAPQRRALIRDKAVIRDRALIKKRALTGISFLEKAEYAKQSFDVYLKRIKKTGKRTCCLLILPD